jgi:inorganic pyrophosphatase
MRYCANLRVGVLQHDYGFIPQTLCDDGDPLDVLVIGDSPLEPGCIVDV